MKNTRQKEKIGKTIWEDIHRGGLRKSFIEDISDLYRFYLDSEEKNRLKEMSRLRRWWIVCWWIMKKLVLRLSPVRRLLLVISIILFIQNTSIDMGDSNISINLHALGFVLLLIILLLELKDKLLARNELAEGRAIQLSLLPSDNPVIPGWDVFMYTRPANDVGGDLIDYLHISDIHWTLALGDVAGKGLPAALLMAKMQATLRALAPHYTSLGKFGEDLNTIFLRDAVPSRFISLVFLEIKENTDAVRFINAGHLPPLIIRNGNLIETEIGNPALGLTNTFSIDPITLSLEKHDWLLIYSDGIIEARNDKGAFFGEKRLKVFLAGLRDQSAEKVGQHLVQEVDAFIGQARPHDDLSFILLRRT